MNSRAYIGKSLWDSSRRVQSTVAEQSLALISDDDEGLGCGEVVGGTRILRYPAPLRSAATQDAIHGAFDTLGHCAPRLLRMLDVARSMHRRSGTVAIQGHHIE
jgi:hypothetical protein